ncbi:hypothetical protein CYMTET_13291 [Cymbomonas tetramitiformis]|uniref:Uncharacterized protein n=1 Tax=Cymbomonas tetramitiformis TaxID=36881 RepID=A0AAE0LBJ6_9CHLO|nr:hypothetical protein CYMTET_13291 [Cymbomonas tetramitiformis]
MCLGLVIAQTKYYYKMKVNALRQMEYKSLDQELSTTFGNSTLVDRHGIRIVFEQSGTIGHFDFQTTLVNLVSALGLMAVGTFFVDTVALYFMSLREVYTKCKIIDTVDFSDYDGVEPLMSHDYCVRSRALAAVGNRLKSIESRIGDVGFNSPYSRMDPDLNSPLLHSDG